MNRVSLLDMNEFQERGGDDDFDFDVCCIQKNWKANEAHNPQHASNLAPATRKTFSAAKGMLFSAVNLGKTENNQEAPKTELRQVDDYHPVRRQRPASVRPIL